MSHKYHSEIMELVQKDRKRRGAVIEHLVEAQTNAMDGLQEDLNTVSNQLATRTRERDEVRSELAELRSCDMYRNTVQLVAEELDVDISPTGVGGAEGDVVAAIKRLKKRIRSLEKTAGGVRGMLTAVNKRVDRLHDVIHAVMSELDIVGEDVDHADESIIAIIRHRSELVDDLESDVVEAAKRANKDRNIIENAADQLGVNIKSVYIGGEGRALTAAAQALQRRVESLKYTVGEGNAAIGRRAAKNSKTLRVIKETMSALSLTGDPENAGGDISNAINRLIVEGSDLQATLKSISGAINKYDSVREDS